MCIKRNANIVNITTLQTFVYVYNRYQWRIQDFPQGGAQTPKIAIIFQIFAENCMKMKEFGPRGASLAPPLGSAMGTKQNR